MAFEVSNIGGVTIIRPEGRLDAVSAQEVRNTIFRLIGEKEMRIVFDLEQTHFIDSSGLGSLVAALRSVTKSGGDVKIARLDSKVRAIFELTRLHRVFDIADTVDDAVQAFSK